MTTEDYTREHIERELERWGRNLTAAKHTENILAMHTALEWIDLWLDRLNNLKIPA